MKRLFFGLLCLVQLVFFFPEKCLATPPNIVLFLADDQGWGDLGIHGNTNLRTPRMDSLAKEGAALENFFVCPVCSPTRAELLTGRYHARCGVRDVSLGGERLNLDEKTMGDIFRAAGYRTGLFGKWHNGTQWPYHPLARGFEEFYGYTSGHWGTYFDAPMDHNGKTVQGKGYMTDDLTTHAIDFITEKAKSKSPFFCMVAFNTPHSPMQVPDAYWNRFEKKELIQKGSKLEDPRFTRAALAMVENIDDNVGRVLDTLKTLKVESNTIVVYLSDNGPNGDRFNGPWKGRKGGLDEGGIRSPCFVRFPAKIPPGKRIPQIVGAIDILPTLAQLSDIPHNPQKPIDGVSISPLLSGDNPAWPQRILYTHWAGKTTARTDTYRLDPAQNLYDVPLDPGQKRDISLQNPATHQELIEALDSWKKQVGIPMTKDDRPFPVGYREMPNTTLPARDGRPKGGVVRSAPAPNDSFFANWSRKTDAITWDVEIATAGQYEATLFMTQKKGDAGARVELSLGDQKCETVLNRPHDPPLRGMENDRSPRRAGESYVKDFVAVPLGRLSLEKCRGLLQLRALEIPGTGVADVKALELKLLSPKGTE